MFACTRPFALADERADAPLRVWQVRSLLSRATLCCDSKGTEPTLKAARKPSRAVNVEAKTHMEAAAFLSHLADIYRHGVSWFSDAGSPAA